jgi:VWFA-related protein
MASRALSLMHVRRLLAIAAAGGLIAGSGVALAGRDQQPPVLRSSVDLVTADVTVLDAQGKPIQGLAGDDFSVEVDGRPRRVVWAEYVPERTTGRDDAAAEHFSTNEHADAGRLVLIAIDQMHIRRVEGRFALRAAAAFIDSLDAGDRVAAAPLTHAGPIEFTTSHPVVKRYLQRLSGEASAMPAHFNIGLSEALAIGDGSRTTLDIVVKRECAESLGRFENLGRIAMNGGMRDPCPVQVEQEGRAFAQHARTEAQASLNAMSRLIARLAEIDGPKTVVLISEGLVAEPQLFDMSALGAAAHAARVTLYVLQLDTPIFEASDTRLSPSMDADRRVRADGLARLAGAARGALFNLVGSDPYPFRRILTELSGYYLVGFEAADADRDGRTHRIAVRTKAAGVTVRARPTFKISPTVTPQAISAVLERLLRNPRPASELPLRVGAYAFQDNTAGGLKLLVSGETDHAGVGREVTMGFVVVDAGGVIVASGGASTESGRYSITIPAPPGRYFLRVAAVDASGRQGSVERQLDARLAGSGAVRFSDLLIAEPTDDADAPLRPAVARASGSRLVAYFEMYGEGQWSPDDLRIAVVATGANGSEAIRSAPPSLRSIGPGRWSVTAGLPLDNIRPGAYLVSAEVSLRGSTPHRLRRTFIVR